MKIIVVSVVAAVVGFCVQFWMRPTVADLEFEATLAWNSGNTQRAEEVSRKVLARDVQSERAGAVLGQIAIHSNRPALQIALAEIEQPGVNPGAQLAHLGTVAMSVSLLRPAEEFLLQSLAMDSGNPRLHRRLVTLAGLRLDADTMKERLLAWCKHGNPDPESVLLYLSISSIEGRDASGALEALKASLTADSGDIQTRCAIARCLIAMGRHDECDSILLDSAGHPVQATLRAMSAAIGGDAQKAQLLLPSSTLGANVADFYFVEGVIASLEKNWAAAAAAFDQAVQLRPLSRTFRSRYCDALRHAEKTSLQRREVKQLQTLLQVLEIARSSETTFDDATRHRLVHLCVALNAGDAVAIVSQSKPR